MSGRKILRLAGQRSAALRLAAVLTMSGSLLTTFQIQLCLEVVAGFLLVVQLCCISAQPMAFIVKCIHSVSSASVALGLVLYNV